MLEITHYVQNSPRAKAIRGDLKITVAEIHGTNIYDATLVLDFESKAGGYTQRQMIQAQAAAMCYITLLTDVMIANTALGHIVKKMYQATTFKQIKELEGRTFTSIGEMH